MTSQDEINLSEHPTDSLDNASEDSHSLNLNSDALFSSAAGPSATRSGNSDPINDIALYDDLDLKNENVVNAWDNLTEDKLNSGDPFIDDDCISETSGQLFMSFEDSSNLLPLDEQTNDVEASLSEGLISQDETGKNASLEETPFNEIEANQQKEISQINPMSFAYGDSSWVNFGASTSSGFGGVSGREKRKKKAGALEKIDSPLDETKANQLKEMRQISSSSTAHKNVFWLNLGAPTTSDLKYDVSEREKDDVKTTSVLKEIDTPLDETEAYQRRKKPQIISSSTNENFFKVNFGASTSGMADVSERKKHDIIKTGVCEFRRDSFQSKNLRKDYAGIVKDSKFETPEDYNLSDHPLNSENKSLHKELNPKQRTILAKPILPQNIIRRDDGSGERNNLFKASNTVVENDSNLKIWPEFAFNDTDSDSFKEVDAHSNPFKSRKHHGRNSISNNNIDTQSSHLSVDELFKYQDLKSITNNFFKTCQQSSLHEDQRKETSLEIEAEIKTTNSPSLIRDDSSIDKGAGNNNGNAQNNIKPTEDCKFEHQILNIDEIITSEISPTSIQDIEKSNLTNKNESGKYGNTAVISNNANNDKTYDFDNSNEGLLLNEFNCDSENQDSNKMELSFSSPRICSLETEGDNFSTGSKTPDGACLEKKMHMPVQYKNNTIHDINNIFCAETNENSNQQQIFNPECQNVFSASTSNLSSMQCMNITPDYRKNAGLFKIKDDSTQNDNESSGGKLEHQILNINENVTAGIPSTSVEDKANSNFTNKSASGKDISTTVISKTENNHFPTILETSSEACLEKGTDFSVQYKNNTIHDINNIFCAETNGKPDRQQIFNTECQNVFSASTSNLSSMQCTNITPDYGQNADLFIIMDDSTQNNNESTDDSKFEHQILNINENVTAGISTTSVEDIANFTNKSDSGKDVSNTVISKTENNHFPTSLETSSEACLEKEAHISGQLQKNSTTHFINKTSFAETNGNYDCQQMFNAVIKNIDSASTSGLNSVEFMSMSSDYQQNADLFRSMDDNFAVQGLISDGKQTAEDSVVDENIEKNIFEPKQNSEVKCSSVTNENPANQPFINESKTTENYISYSNKTPMSFDMHEIREHSSESLHRQAKTPDFKNDDEDTISLESPAIPPNVSEPTKAYITENEQFDETSPIEENKSACVSDSSEDIMKSQQSYARQEDVNLNLILPPTEELVGQNTNLRRSQRLINLANRHSNKASVVTTASHKELDKADTEKQTSKRISPDDQTVDAPRDSKKLKSCKVQPKSRRTTSQTITKEDFVSTENLRKAGKVSDIRTSEGEKQTSKRTSPGDQSNQSLTDAKKLKSCKTQPQTLSPTPQADTKGDFVSAEKSRKKVVSSATRNTKENSVPSSYLRMAEVLRKYDSKHQEPSISKHNELDIGPRKFNDIRAGENSSLSLSHSCEGTLANEGSIPLPFLRMAEVLRKYDKLQEPSTSTNNEFEPRILTDNRTEENSSLSLSNSREHTSAVQTVFEATVTAVKQLNSGNGSTVLDIVSYVRSNLPSNEKKLSQDVRKALKDATAAGFLELANGKYKEISMSIEEKTSKEPAKRKTTRVNDNSKTQSKRLKPDPTVSTRTLRPRTTRVTRESSAGPTNDSRK